ncbi:sodium/hydrogen exchanger 9B2-like isoform X1 [Styela clava]
MENNKSHPSIDSGLSAMGQLPIELEQQKTTADISDVNEFPNMPAASYTNTHVLASAEYQRYKSEAVKIAEDTLTDGKRVITNPGWHAGKSGLHQIPLDMDKAKSLPGYGITGDTCCSKTALFCANICGCPSEKTLRIGSIKVVSRIIMAVLAWGFVWSVTFPPCATENEDAENETISTTSHTETPEECIIPGLPGSSLFAILMIFLFGMVAEALIVLIPMPANLPPLPPLLGSLLIGILLRNVPGINIATDIDELWSSRLRNMALGIILGRAGLEVDKKQMYNLRWVVPRLSFLPCITEACSYGLFAHWILGLPWEWSFMLGFVCGAVAPACVVPSMIKFQEEGYGVDHGVPSLLIAAASIDDIVAINVFNILLTITFGGSSIGYNIGIAVAEIVLGIVLGFVGGFFLQKVPDRRQHNVVRDRTFLLIALSFFFIFVTDGPIELAGAGTLGTLLCSFIAAIGWQHNQAEAVAQHFKGIWFFFQPLLFGLTGATVDFSKMDGHTVALSLGCMLICLAIRLTVAGNAVSFLGWSHKEKFMTAISWIPKATVQAAIGGTALNKVHLECGDILSKSYCEHPTEATKSAIANVTNAVTRHVFKAIDDCIVENTTEAFTYEKCKKDEEYALIILQVSVLLILITAPVGVFLIGVAGPRLLKRSPTHAQKADEEQNGELHEDASDHSDTGVWDDGVYSIENGLSGKTNLNYEDENDGETKL